MNALEEAAMIKNAQPLTLQGVRALRRVWLGVRDGIRNWLVNAHEAEASAIH